VNVGIKVFVFPDSDNYSYMSSPKMVSPDGKEVVESEEDKNIRLENQQKDITRQRQREITEGISFMIVGIPLYFYHWTVIQKEPKNKT